MVIKRRRYSSRGEPLPSVPYGGSNGAIIVNGDVFVGVTDGKVEGKVVAKSVSSIIIACNEVKLGDGGVGDAELDIVGPDDEPEEVEGKEEGEDGGAVEEAEAGDYGAAAAATTNTTWFRHIQTYILT